MACRVVMTTDLHFIHMHHEAKHDQSGCVCVCVCERERQTPTPAAPAMILERHFIVNCIYFALTS